MKTYREQIGTKVTRTAAGWLCSLTDAATGNRIGETVKVKTRQEVGPALAELLRWYDKAGGVSRMAAASRDRNCR